MSSFLARLATDGLSYEYKPMKDVPVNEWFEIIKFRTTNGNFGKACIVYYRLSGGEPVKSYLPPRFAEDSCSDSECRAYNSGRSPRLKFRILGFTNNSANVEFAEAAAAQ
jgi:hypothetical protein